MSLDTLDQKTVDSLPHLPDVYDAYGVRVNELSVSEIFTLYEHTGFLYPDKAARLFPHLEQVRENCGECCVPANLSCMSSRPETRNEGARHLRFGGRRTMDGCRSTLFVKTIPMHLAR